MAGGGNAPNNYGGGGSGGAVRLVSNTITKSGYVYLCGGKTGDGGSGIGAGGIIRFEAFTIAGASEDSCPNSSGGLRGIALSSSPYNLALPVGGLPSLKVTSVNGVSINANPFNFPDVSINNSSSVQIVLSGTNIPSGTNGNLYIFSENSPDQTFTFTLTGSLASTTATVSMPFPMGGSRGFAKVVWNQ